MSELQLTKAEAEKLLDQYHARIAELEAENARLRDLGYGVERERDEARAEIGRLKSQHEIWSSDLRRERDEARAACAVKDAKLRQLEFSHGDETCPACWRNPHEPECGLAAALSSTAGSELLAQLHKVEGACITLAKDKAELLARLEMLEKAVENRGRVLDLETARLEKAEAGHCATLVSDHETMKSMQAQIESMRTVLMEVTAFPQREKGRRWHSANHQGPQDCQGCRIEAALSPSAPRLYRNAVLEKAALKLESLGGDFFTCAPAVRALKTEDDK